MTDHFSDLEQAFQQEVAGLKEFYGPKNGTIRIIGFSCTCTVWYCCVLYRLPYRQFVSHDFSSIRDLWKKNHEIR